MKHLNFGRELFDMYRHTQKRLRKTIEIELKNAQAGFKVMSDVTRRNRKLRNKYCMSGRIW